MTEYCEPTLESVLRIAAQDAVTWAHTLSILQDGERNEIDMTEQINPLPEFFPYKIPYGATIPKGTRFVSPVETVTDTAYVNMVHQDTVHHSSYENGWTATPLDPPTPKKEDPPTEVGTLLTNVHTIQGHTCDYMILTSASSFPWKSINLNGKQNGYGANHLVSWTRLDATPAEPADKNADQDALDEFNYAPRLLDNNILTLRECGGWHVHPKDSCDCYKATSHKMGDFSLNGWANMSNSILTFAPSAEYNEDDHSDRLDSNGQRWSWFPTQVRSVPNSHWSICGPRGTTFLKDLKGVVFAPQPKEAGTNDPMDKNDSPITFAPELDPYDEEIHTNRKQEDSDSTLYWKAKEHPNYPGGHWSFREGSSMGVFKLSDLQGIKFA